MSPEPTVTRVVFPTLGATRPADDERARARGHAAGYAEGLRRAEADAAVAQAARDAEHQALLRAAAERAELAMAALRAATAGVQATTIPVVAEAQDTLAAAAVELAEAVIGVELADGPTSARSALLRATAHVDAGQILTVHLNPADLADLPTHDLPGVVMVADPTLARGDAVARLKDGFLDARVGAALDRARLALAGAA